MYGHGQDKYSKFFYGLSSMQNTLNNCVGFTHQKKKILTFMKIPTIE